MVLCLYNTLTRKKQVFKPIKKGNVGLYTCGPTVYHTAHVGNLRTYVFEDILKRVLLYNKYKVRHVMNITDVGHLTSDADTGEDKVEAASKKEGKDTWKLSAAYTKQFQSDIQKLNILSPDVWCKATDHIKEQIDWIMRLERLGYTYRTSDGIYFDTSKFKNYGAMALLERQLLQAGKRIAIGEKKNSTDFAVWKFSPKKEKRHMEWDSPWGTGFPGWHIECSVMATKYLGSHFDIHCGGIDHIPIHHTNEIAQTEAVTKKPWVNVWMHGEFLIVEEEKMSKSKGNILSLDALEKQEYDPLDFRYLCLTAHYRKQMTFSKEAINGAQASLKKLQNRITEIEESATNGGKTNVTYQKEFLVAINDDLNIPRALAVAWNLLKDTTISSEDKYATWQEFNKVFCITQGDKKDGIPKRVIEMAEERQKARAIGNFKVADEIRQKITNEGFTIEDKKGKYVLKR